VRTCGGSSPLSRTKKQVHRIWSLSSVMVALIILISLGEGQREHPAVRAAMTSLGRNGTSLMHKAEGAGNPGARCRRARVSRFGVWTRDLNSIELPSLLRGQS